MDVIAQLEIELTYYDFVILYVNTTLPLIFFIVPSDNLSSYW